MFPDGLPFCTVHISPNSGDSHRREYRDGNHTDLHTDLHMVGLGSGDDDCTTGLLQPTQARRNRQRTIHALIGKCSSLPERWNLSRTEPYTYPESGIFCLVSSYSQSAPDAGTFHVVSSVLPVKAYRSPAEIL